MARARSTRVEEADEDEILVSVGRTGKKVERYSITAEDPTVEDALEAAGITVSKGDRVRLDGETVELDEPIEDGAIITVAGKVSGGSS